MNKIINYNMTDQAVADLKKKYATVPDALTVDGYKACKAGNKEVRAIEIAVEKKRKELNGDAQEHVKKVNGEAKRITALLEPIRLPMLTAFKKVDDAKAEAARKEATRKSDISENINGMAVIVSQCLGTGTGMIEGTIAKIEEVNTSEGFDEFEEMAKETKADTLKKLNDLLDLAKSKKKQDKEIADLKAKNAALEAEKNPPKANKEKPAIPEKDAPLPEPTLGGESEKPKNWFICEECEHVHDLGDYVLVKKA